MQANVLGFVDHAHAATAEAFQERDSARKFVEE